MSEPWQFWIDVGGTFTDCLARSPQGKFIRHKGLSSAVINGSVAAGSTDVAICDPLRSGDPADCWVGYQLTLLDANSRPLATRSVVGFNREDCRIQLSAPLEETPRQGTRYELTSDELAPVLAIRMVLGLSRRDAIPPVVVRLGTTRGTNALLTRTGARTALLVTQGFGDVLQIGYQNRPRLFELSIHKPEPLFEQTVEIIERVASDGTVLVPLDESKTRQQLAALRAQGLETLAICLLHGYRYREHEEQVATIARDVGFEEISLSHEVAPLEKIVARGDTTLADAYLNPVLRKYVSRLRQSLGESELRVLTSAGGLVKASRFSGKDSILSGPAGGVVGFSRVALAGGFRQAIGFDMGGTSTDVARFDGAYDMQYEAEKAGVRIVAPMMAIETVAAGGGSVCHFDGVRLRVGPDSAGADPGPACYGRGGPLTVTDMNLYLGRLLADRFPFTLDCDVVEEKLREMCGAIQQGRGHGYSPEELAASFLQIANANMAQAISSISTAKGANLNDYVLVAFGGAAGQHACAVARQLGIRKILNHPDSGILSAFGIGLADVVRHRTKALYQRFDRLDAPQLESVFSELERQAACDVQAEGIAVDQIEVRRLLEMRYQGLDASLVIPQPDDDDYLRAFNQQHTEMYGYAHADRPVEAVAVRVEGIGKSSSPVAETQSVSPNEPPEPLATATMSFNGTEYQGRIFDREQLAPGMRLHGPAVLAEKIATTVVDPGWEVEVLSRGELLLHDTEPTQREQVSLASDPAQIELFNNRLTAIAERMGITLRNTASSVNVKERLDFSCAIFTPDGDLVVNAPHIPVHLGAMSETVRCIIADNPDLQPGDVLVTNDPYRGGSHLPDITVVTPVFNAQQKLLFLTASRAHHAEIGGIRPGSMPPMSKNLAEEGVLIRNFRLATAEGARFEPLGELLRTAPYPSRNVADNLADLAAQVAANRRGAQELLALVDRYSLSVVQAYMRHVQTAAAEKTRLALHAMPDGEYSFADHMDDGSPIRVKLTIAKGHAQVDFSGTGPVLRTNLNANRAITTAATLYCLRLLIAEDIPLNQGVLEPVDLILPTCLLNPSPGATAADSPAVAGGNVETSQRVVDVLLGALELAAASQGTMNNLLFGDDTFGYYETIGGGAGATAEADGAAAVHTHMTNTRLTDPEVLERLYPVRVRQFSIRHNSGGTGKYRGGDGIVRELEFLRPLEVSLLTSRRGPYAPYGIRGGSSGACGINRLHRADRDSEDLPAVAQFSAAPGDVLRIETPGGGAYGVAAETEPSLQP